MSPNNIIYTFTYLFYLFQFHYKRKYIEESVGQNYYFNYILALLLVYKTIQPKGTYSLLPITVKLL